MEYAKWRNLSITCLLLCAINDIRGCEALWRNHDPIDMKRADGPASGDVKDLIPNSVPVTYAMKMEDFQLSYATQLSPRVCYPRHQSLRVAHANFREITQSSP